MAGMATLSRRARTESTRQTTEAALVAATVQLLERGAPFAELGIEQIARTAGFSRPTFYAYFDDKRALILTMGRAFRDELAIAADPWLSADHDELRPTLVEVLEVFRRHRAVVAAVVEAATYDAEVAEFWRALHNRFLATAEQRIRRSDPTADRAHAHARAFALVWMTERAITEHLATPSAQESALIDELTRFWQDATSPPPS